MKNEKANESIEGIAIIGMAGRFAKAANIDEFWRNLCNGVEAITLHSREEMIESGVSLRNLNNPNWVPASASVEGIELLDASFFGFNPSEAEVIDPQQRVFLECAWEALETAAYNSDEYENRIGVYAGAGSKWYNKNLSEHGDGFLVSIGNSGDYLATRVSYKLNLRGPSMTVQTACSTSLVAICLACQSLLTYQTDLALAGGVSLSLSKGYLYEEGSIHSPDGHCRTFDAKAKGTIFSSGAGVVVLKRLSEAIADRDQIYGVIKGFAVNNDGISKIGYTAPSVEGQAQVVTEAIAMAGVDPETISYVEAHGTATSLGDPIEIAALSRAFRAGTQKRRFCAIGSVKTNIGHTDTAAGVAGVMKAALCLKHRKIPASLNFEEPNPLIDFENSPFYVNTKLSEWNPDHLPRRAGVSSFGIGGTNAHVILEEAPPAPDSGPSRSRQLLLLSAKTATALDAMTANLVERLKKNPDANLADVAYTLQVGRKVFDHRRMLVAGSLEDAVDAFERQDASVVTSFQDQTRRPAVFMFPGQGAQHAQMAFDLYREEPAFREHVDRCCELIKPDLGLDLREVLYPESANAEEAARLLSQTFITQPALFVVEYALARLWMEWGVQPEAMIGHSIGEYIAACLSGVLSLEDALKLVVQRGRVMQAMPPGAMLSVSMSAEQIRPLLGERLSVAAINAPSLCVVSGEIEAVESLERRMAEEGVFCRRLHTSHAFHSEMMEPALAPFVEEVRKVRLNPPKIPYISNVTGTWITEAEATDPHYWANHLRQAVRFSDGIFELLKNETRVLLEVGPGQTSLALVKLHPDSAPERAVVASLRRLQEQCSDLEFALGALGRLWLAGAQIDWRQFYAREQRRRVALSTYSFERQRFWVARRKSNAESKEPSASLGKKPDIADWGYVPYWKQTVPAAFLKGTPSSDQQSRWLVFMDDCGLGDHLTRRLKQDGREVIRVGIGEEFAELDDDTFTVNPAKQDDYAALLKRLGKMSKTPNLIAHLWSVTHDGTDHSGIELFEKYQDLCFYSLLFLAQALEAHGYKDPIQIGIVSNRMQDVTGGEEQRFEKATLLGPCRVIPQEYPNISCRSVDVDISESPQLLERTAELLIMELERQSPDAVIAYRGGQRWARTVEPARLADDIRGAIPLREAGVYLITGGVGGIGLALAQHLARTAKTNLVLTTRSAFPVREEWQDYLDTHEDQDELSVRITQALALEEMGAKVLVFTADVTDHDQMRAVIRQTHDRFGPIHGVIHSAGVPSGGLIQLKTREMTAAIFAPKVRGAFILDSLLRDEKLDFFLVFSSLTSLLGAVGQVDYCAANAFLDAFAKSRSRRCEGLTASVGWDAWAEVGMAVKAKKIWPMRPGAGLSQERQQADSNGSQSIHPLLEECVYEGDQQTFVTQFNPAKQWVLGQHRIQGYPTLVGTSYLEMARAAFETRENGNGGALEIRDVIFLEPMVADDGESREVRLVLKKVENGYEFVARSEQASSGNGESRWQEHVRGTLARVNAEPPCMRSTEEWPVNGSAADATTSNGFSHATRASDARASRTGLRSPVSLGPRWNSTMKYVIEGNRGWASLELPEEYSAELDYMKLHPALMDSATSFALRIIDMNALFLPFSYGKVKIIAPLSRKIRSYARLREESALDKGIVSFDIVITNDEGLELVKVEAFTMKNVGAVDIGSRAGKVARGAGAGTPSDANAILPGEGVEVFSRLLSNHLPPEVFISTRHLPALIEQAKASTSEKIAERMEKKNQKAKATYPRPALKTPYVAPQDDLEKEIAGIWQTALGIEPIGVNDNFLELGGHSLLAIQIVNRLRDAYAISLPMDSVFKSPTVAEVAKMILTTLTEQVDESTLAELLDDLEQSTT
jgi:acyl transferase domain-containing protein